MKYQYSIERLHAGSSLGNLFTFVQLDKQSNIHGVWSSIDNSFYLGNMLIDFSADSEEIFPRETTFDPLGQTTLFETNGMQVTKRVWLPFSDDVNALREDLQRVLVEIEAHNSSEVKKNFKSVANFLFPAFVSPVFSKKPPQKETKKKYRIHHDSKSLTAQEISTQRTTAIRFSEPPSSCVTDDKTARVQFDWNVSPHEKVFLRIALILEPGNEKQPDTEYHAEVQNVWREKSLSALENMLSKSNFVTPSGVINRGIYWAKVNTVRVQHRFRSGFGFTNDPPQDIIVVRDLAWYAMGCDYLAPQFSRSLIDLAEEFCFHADGKLTEFIHADEVEPVLHDYDLNINDGTPLFILALEHHALACGDSEFTKKAFGFSALAANYIISQLRDGLIYCDAKGVHVWGIASWRNIIDDHNLTGYVTEINSECCAALRASAHLAILAGAKSLADKYTAEAEKLEKNILAKLRGDNTSLFYLNIDQEGKPHENITGDLVFPALCGIGDKRLRLKIVDRLFNEDIWTDFGARTVAKTDPTYNPQSGINLMGGIWPNLTAWFAMVAKETYPQRVAEAMEKIYKISEVDSTIKFGNVVPGEFPERLHGDNFKSMGMGISPWMPPTYLWLAIEGLLGLSVQKDCVRISPALPNNWKFLCVLKIPIKNRVLNVIVYDGVLYTDMEVKSELPTRVGNFRQLENSNDIMVFQFSDKIGTRVFAFSPSSFEGNISIRSNAHSKKVSVKLNENEMKEVLVNEAD